MNLSWQTYLISAVIEPIVFVPISYSANALVVAAKVCIAIREGKMYPKWGLLVNEPVSCSSVSTLPTVVGSWIVPVIEPPRLPQARISLSRIKKLVSAGRPSWVNNWVRTEVTVWVKVVAAPVAWNATVRLYQGRSTTVGGSLRALIAMPFIRCSKRLIWDLALEVCPPARLPFFDGMMKRKWDASGQPGNNCIFSGHT